jgi:hypothetical protein
MFSVHHHDSRNSCQPLVVVRYFRDMAGVVSSGTVGFGSSSGLCGTRAFDADASRLGIVEGGKKVVS